MRCPVCDEETPLGLSRCVHCNSSVESSSGARDGVQSWPPPPAWQPSPPPQRSQEPDPLGEAPWAAPVQADATSFDSGETRMEPRPQAEPTRMEPHPQTGETRMESSPQRPWEQGGADAASTQALPPIQDPWNAAPAAHDPWMPGAHAPAATPWEPDAADEGRNHTLVQPWEPDPSWQQNPQQGYIPPPSPPADPWAPPQRPQGGRRNTALFVAAWVIVATAAVAAVAIFFWPRHSGSTAHNRYSPAGTTQHNSSPASTSSSSAPATPSSAAPTGPAATQAADVNSLLDTMGNSRTEFAGAMTQAEQCDTLGAALPTLQKVVDERKSELSTAQSLQVDALPSGSQLKDALNRALQASLDADNAYLTWANNNQNCSGTTPEDGDYDNGNQISTDRATPAKQEFIQLWSPVAQQYGQPARDADHI